MEIDTKELDKKIKDINAIDETIEKAQKLIEELEKFREILVQKIEGEDNVKR